MTTPVDPEPPVLEGLAKFTNVKSGPVQGWVRKESRRRCRTDQTGME